MTTIGARAHDFPFHTPEELFDAIAESGYRAVQLACPKSFSWSYPLTEEQTERIRAASERTGVRVSVLGCYVDPAAQDPEARRKAVETYINGIRTAKELGALCVGTETTYFGMPESERPAAMERLTDSVLRMAEAAEKYGVNMGIEPVFEHTLSTPELALELKRRVDSPRLKWIWDAVNQLDPSLRQENAIHQRHTAELLGEDILAMHIKGVRWKQTGVKQGCPLSESEFDWRFPFEWASGQPDMVLLREEAIPARAAEEISLMRALLK